MYTATKYRLAGTPLTAVGYVSFFKYNEIKFSPYGKLSANVSTFEEMQLKGATLTPLQKIELLRSYVIPRGLQTLVLGRITRGLLERFDKAVRVFTRETTRESRSSMQAGKRVAWGVQT